MNALFVKNFTWFHLFLRRDFLLLCILKKEDDLYLNFCSFTCTNLCQIKDSGLCNYHLQRDEVKIRSWKQKWFPAQYAATSCMPAQLLLLNGCQNIGDSRPIPFFFMSGFQEIIDPKPNKIVEKKKKSKKKLKRVLSTK